MTLFRIAQVSLLAVLLPNVITFAQAIYWNWGYPDYLMYEFRHTGLQAVIVIALFAILPFSKTVVATVAAVFAFAGFHDVLFYEWSEYMADEMKWSIPFAICSASLIALIWSERRKPTET